MATTVKLSDSLVLVAQATSQLCGRTLEEQIAHWVTIGKIVEDNPDLTYEFIKNILKAKQEATDLKKLKTYKFNANSL